MRKFVIGLIGTIILIVAAGVVIFVFVTARGEGEYFLSKNVRLHYTVEGHGEAVVLLHGFAVNSDLNWRMPGITKKLAEVFRVISLDLRGHGLSNKPHEKKQYGKELIGDVVRLLDQLQIDKTHVVGYSLGGFIALKLMVTHPHRIITGAILGAGWEHPENPEFMGWLQKLAADLRSGRGIAPLSGHLGSDRQEPSFLHTWSVKVMTSFFNDREALAAMIESLPEIAVSREELRHIGVPILTIVGSNDPLKMSAEAMIDFVPNIKMIIVENADHISTIMRNETHAELLWFLLKHRGKKV